MFRQHTDQFQYFVRQVGTIISRCYGTKTAHSRNNAIDNEIAVSSRLPVAFFSKNIGSTHYKWNLILNRHPELKFLNPKNVVNIMKILRKLNFSSDDVLSTPMILKTRGKILENRYCVLKECGFEKVTISVLSNYASVINRNVTTLKSFGHIPHNFNVVEQLQQSFTDIQLQVHTKDACNESLELKILRQRILNNYLQQRLYLSNEEIEKLWKSYGSLKHRSFRSLQRMIKTLLEDLKFSKERIFKDGFVLNACPDNVQRIITEIPTICGQDIKELIFKKPKIITVTCDHLITILHHVKSFGIGEDAVLNHLEILFLEPNTVLERLSDLNAIAEFRLFVTNPGVLRLVYYKNRVTPRLDYLHQIKSRYASLHMLSCSSKAFTKSANNGANRPYGCDTVVYLADILDQTERHIRQLLSRQTNWVDIPASQVKQCYKFLRSETFSKVDIYNNIQILFYPIKRIDKKLQQLKNPNFLRELLINTRERSVNKSEILALALYLIESEFHFNGDGMWMEEHAEHVENFNNLLPDFLESLNEI